jgi:hypothetical protein
MSERQIVEALNGSLDGLIAGLTVEDCLRAYPDVAGELRPLLETGQTISRARASSTELRDVRSRVDARIIALIQQTEFKSHRFRPSQGRMVLVMAIVVMVLIGVVFFLRRGDGETRFAAQTTPTLATELPTTPSPVATTAEPERPFEKSFEPLSPALPPQAGEGRRAG